MSIGAAEIYADVRGFRHWELNPTHGHPSQYWPAQRKVTLLIKTNVLPLRHTAKPGLRWSRPTCYHYATLPNRDFVDQDQRVTTAPHCQTGTSLIKTNVLPLRHTAKPGSLYLFIYASFITCASAMWAKLVLFLLASICLFVCVCLPGVCAKILKLLTKHHVTWLEYVLWWPVEVVRCNWSDHLTSDLELNLGSICLVLLYEVSDRAEGLCFPSTRSLIWFSMWHTCKSGCNVKLFNSIYLSVVQRLQSHQMS